MPLDQEPKLPSSNLRIARLEQVVTEQPTDSIRYALANAELAALSGAPAAASSLLREILGRFWADLQTSHSLLASALVIAIAAFDLDAAAAIVNRRFEADGWFDLGLEDNSHRHPDVIRWEIRDKTSSKIWFDNKFPLSPAMESVIVQFVSVLPLLVSYRNYDGFSDGSLVRQPWGYRLRAGPRLL